MKHTLHQHLITWSCIALVFTLPLSTFAQDSLSSDSKETSSEAVTLPVRRTLVDTKGRKLGVTVLSFTDTKLKVKRQSDGKEFSVPIASLSEGDQKFAKKLQLPALSVTTPKDKAKKKGDSETLATTFEGVDFPLQVFGPEDAKKAVVIFGSTGFKLSSFKRKLSEFDPLFEDGWNVVVFNYPKSELFTTKVPKVLDSFWKLKRGGKFRKKLDLKGFGEAVFKPIKKSAKYEHIVFLGNSLGTGAMAWDLEKIQSSNSVSVLWVSPTEMFLPKTKELKKLKNIKVVAMLEEYVEERARVNIKHNDNFVQSSSLKKWIRSNPFPENTFGKLPGGRHLILGDKMPWKSIVDYLVEHKQ